MIKQVLWGGVAVAAALGVEPAVAGEGVDVAPGLWRATSAVRLDVGGTVSTRTETRETCVVDGVLEPTALFNEESGCDWDALEVVGEEMTFDLVCRENGQVMRGPARFAMQAGAGAGAVALTGEIDGAPVTMTVEMRAERAGGC